MLHDDDGDDDDGDDDHDDDGDDDGDDDDGDDDHDDDGDVHGVEVWLVVVCLALACNRVQQSTEAVRTTSIISGHWNNLGKKLLGTFGFLRLPVVVDIFTSPSLAAFAALAAFALATVVVLNGRLKIIWRSWATGCCPRFRLEDSRSIWSVVYQVLGEVRISKRICRLQKANFRKEVKS